jgi:hypothetical protein
MYNVTIFFCDPCPIKMTFARTFAKFSRTLSDVMSDSNLQPSVPLCVFLARITFEAQDVTKVCESTTKIVLCSRLQTLTTTPTYLCMIFPVLKPVLNVAFYMRRMHSKQWIMRTGLSHNYYAHFDWLFQIRIVNI